MLGRYLEALLAVVVNPMLTVWLSNDIGSSVSPASLVTMTMGSLNTSESFWARVTSKQTDPVSERLNGPYSKRSDLGVEFVLWLVCLSL